MYKIFIACMVLFLWGCKNKPDPFRSGANTKHTFTDPFVTVADTQTVFQYSYRGHQVLIAQSGCRLLKRTGSTTAKQLYSLAIPDSLKTLFFSLASDLSALNTEQTRSAVHSITLLHGGFISIDDQNIYYLPPHVYSKLLALHGMFEPLFTDQDEDDASNGDLPPLDSLLFSNTVSPSSATKSLQLSLAD